MSVHLLSLHSRTLKCFLLMTQSLHVVHVCSVWFADSVSVVFGCRCSDAELWSVLKRPTHREVQPSFKTSESEGFCRDEHNPGTASVHQNKPCRWFSSFNSLKTTVCQITAHVFMWICDVKWLKNTFICHHGAELKNFKEVKIVMFSFGLFSC